jgi:hypothetical protein
MWKLAWIPLYSGMTDAGGETSASFNVIPAQAAIHASRRECDGEEKDQSRRSRAGLVAAERADINPGAPSRWGLAAPAG